MADNTKIEWCDATFNPWVGCTKVSPACDHCYAEGWAKRTGHPDLWQGERRRTTESYWHQPVKWNRAAEASGVRKRVFCASLADVFDNQVPTRWRDDLWHRIDQTPWLDWLLLTKRPQNIAKMLPDERMGAPPWGKGWPNVWIGTTAEDQPHYDQRWPHLAVIPAAVRFVSYEPALGPLRYLTFGTTLPHWLIAGGESGPGARPSHPDWFRALRDQCAAAGVPYFFKQWGEWIDWRQCGADQVVNATPRRRSYAGPTMATVKHRHAPLFGGRAFESRLLNPGMENSLRVGKARAGRLLDGVTHDAFPEPRP